LNRKKKKKKIFFFFFSLFLSPLCSFAYIAF
jgi:hypothetical protein